MDRRTTIRKFLGVETAATVGNRLQEDSLPLGAGLSPYAGTWNYANAAHLLRRAMFGPSHDQILQAVSDGLDKTLDKLLKSQALPPAPVIYTDTPDDPDLNKGDVWVRAKLNPGIQANVQSKQNSLTAWLMEQIFNENVSLIEKMTLFWHNHFVVSEVYDPRYNYEYISLLRSNCLGNFKALTELITIDKAMLVYLNGVQNTKIAPNENFARELMELFTLGKGELAGPGDYTTFTEIDVLAFAKALTGWVIKSDRQNESFYPYADFNPNLHDTTVKLLSARFPGISISNGGKDEYKQVINAIFTKPEAATFICRKLYRYFVYYKVNASIETDIVNGLADILTANNFDIAPVVRALLASDHFYTQEALGAMIRPPYEFVFNTLKTMKFKPPTDLEEKYNVFLYLYRSTMGMQQVYFDIPSVAGWTPYYQEPSFHEIWVNSVTLPIRNTLTSGMATKTVRIRNANGLFGLDLVAYVSAFSNPADATKLISDITTHLLPQTIFQNQLDFLKNKLLGTNTEAQWATMWNNYSSNPTNAQAKTVVETRLKPLFVSLLSMPEYYLS
ncbi:MAG: DUF1800 domain-containing protein [Saprospiraceae bacterium]